MRSMSAPAFTAGILLSSLNTKHNGPFHRQGGWPLRRRYCAAVMEMAIVKLPSIPGRIFRFALTGFPEVKITKSVFHPGGDFVPHRYFTFGEISLRNAFSGRYLRGKPLPPLSPIHIK